MDKNKTLNLAKTALEQALAQKKLSEEMLRNLGPAVIEVLQPILNEISQNSKISKEEIVEALSHIQINVPKVDVPHAQVEVTIPEIKVPTPQVSVTVPDIKIPDFPEIKIPTIKVPKPEVTVNFDASKIKIPDFKMPEEMDIRGWVGIMGYDKGLLSNPIPVQIRDASGKPIDFGGNITNVVSGGGGGPRRVKIDNTASEPIPISGTISATFSADFGQGETASQTLRTVAATDSIQSVNIVSGSASGTEYTDGQTINTPSGGILMVRDSNASIFAAVTGIGTGDGRTLRVVHATDSVVSVNIVSGSSSGAVGQGDAASATRVVIAGNSDASVVVNSGTLTGITNTLTVDQLSGATWSVFASNPVNQGDAATALRVVVAGNSDVSVTATQTGTWNIGTVTTVTGITNSVAAAMVDSTGVQYSGANPMPLNMAQVGGNATKNSQGDGASATGMLNVLPMMYNGSTHDRMYNGNGLAANALRVVHAADAGMSVSATGDVAHDAADSGNPVKIGGIARTTAPTAVADADRVNAAFDKVGRQLTTPIQVRDLISTAYATLSNGTEATLISAVAGSYLDLIYVMGTNNSDAAVQVDLRAVTAGNVVTSIMIPGGGSAGVSLPRPLPQSDTGNNWTVDMPDVTGTTVTISAMFSREI